MYLSPILHTLTQFPFPNAISCAHDSISLTLAVSSQEERLEAVVYADLPFSNM